VRPVRLRLLTGESAQTQKGFPAWRSQVGHHPAELADTARVAPRLNHLQRRVARSARILLQGLAQEVEVRIGQLRAQAGLAAEAVGIERPAYGIGVEKEFKAQWVPIFPMLGVKQMADANDLFIRNHAALGKRIHPASPATADLTDDPARWVFGLQPRGKNCRRRGFGRLRSRRRCQVHTGEARRED